MKILVTGAPGWLGTRLVEILREKNEDVRCIVLPESDDSIITSLGAQSHRGNIVDARSLVGSCDGIDIVFHCAGIIHPSCVKELHQINVDGTKNILEEAIKARVKKIIYVSSNSVGGVNISRDTLMTELDQPRPYKHYGISKYKAEELVNRASSEGKIKTTIIRPCWFYGIRQPERQTTFFRMIKKGNPLVFGDGKNLRSMSYIDNIIDALCLIKDNALSDGKTYWIADRKAYPTIEIYETIAKLLEVKNFKPIYVPGFSSSVFELADTLLQGFGLYQKEIHVAGEMNKDIACSIEKAQRELGYNPNVDLTEGMRRSIEWCRANNIQI
ncbi:MAG: NAD(P)-dependent oxidoreductase [Candidatus Omnitrophota bacterium]|nr:NAD(P)-dependent oxidoreductase [Candidatus Omnitrophota bacterium]